MALLLVNHEVIKDALPENFLDITTLDLDPRMNDIGKKKIEDSLSSFSITNNRMGMTSCSDKRSQMTGSLTENHVVGSIDRGSASNNIGNMAGKSITGDSIWNTIASSTVLGISYTYLLNHSLVNEDWFVYFTQNQHYPVSNLSNFTDVNDNEIGKNRVENYDRVVVVNANGSVDVNSNMNCVVINDNVVDSNVVSMTEFMVGEVLPHQFVRDCAFINWIGLLEVTFHIDLCLRMRK